MVLDSTRFVGRSCQTTYEIICRKSESGCIKVNPNINEGSHHPLEIVLDPDQLMCTA